MVGCSLVLSLVLAGSLSCLADLVLGADSSVGRLSVSYNYYYLVFPVVIVVAVIKLLNRCYLLTYLLAQSLDILFGLMANSHSATSLCNLTYSECVTRA